MCASVCIYIRLRGNRRREREVEEGDISDGELLW